jgi:excisionase family DNA binding protein
MSENQLGSKQNSDELLQIAESAEIAKVHVNTIRNFIYNGDLPAVRIGARIIRIRRSDLEKLFTPYTPGEYGIWRGQVGGN